jgi:hypothetical protein
MSINTSSPNATFHVNSATSGATLLNLEGTNGSLFSVVDNLSGSLMSVNNNAGLPVFEVFSDDRVVGGRFGQNDWIITSGGNVGIGTGVPSSKFHVVGSVLFSSGLSVTGLITSNSGIITGSGSASSPSHSFIGNTNAGFYNPATNAISLATSGVDRLYVDSLGNVGINTTVPQNGFKLDVNGAAVIRGSILTNSTIQEFGNSRYQLHSGAASNSVSYVCNGGGRFGVGFTTPSGLVAISGGVSIGSNYNLTSPTNGLIVEGNVGVGTSSPNGRLHINGTGLFDGRLSVSPTTAITSPLSVLHVSGSVTNNASLMISGPLSTRTYLGVGNSDTIPFFSSLDGNISASVNGWGFFDRGTDGHLQIQRKSNNTSWNPVFTLNRNTGYFGIGTGLQATTGVGGAGIPERLVVDGTIRIADDAGRLQLYRGGGTAYDYTIGKEGNHLAISTASDSTTFRYTQFGYHASNGTWNPKTVINGFNGNIGVGTTSPNTVARLTIAGSGNTSDSAGLSIVNSSSSNILYVRDDGNIGVGTTNPTSTLQVSGLITANSGNFTQSLQVNGTGVWHSGNLDSNTIVRTAGNQTISGVKTFADGLKVVGNGINTPIELGSSEDAVVLFGKTSNGLGINSVSASYNDGGTNYIDTRELLIGKGANSPGADEQLLFAGNSGIGVVHYFDNGGGVSSSRLIFDVPAVTTLASANTTLRTTTANGNNIVLNLPNTSGTLALLTNINTTQITGVLSVSKGGTNTSTYSNGQLLIGSGTSLVANTLSAGTGIAITNGSGTINIATTGLANYDTSVFNLGTISGTNAINCGQDRQIQTLTLNGVATTFTTGTGWPSSSSVARETTLNIFSSGNTSVTWTIVNDWYRQPDSPLPSGRHIVLLRSIGSGTMQGHYIGNKTN